MDYSCRRQIFPVAIAVMLLGPTAGAGRAAADGRETFAELCAPCHGSDGRARTPAGRKLRAGDLTQSKLSAAEVGKRIAEGLRTEKGVERMPPFGGKLTPEQIEAVTAAVLALRK